MKQKIMGLFLGITIMLAGCGEQSEQIVESIDYTPQDVSWEIAYEVPTSSANVLVDREGYATDKAKIVCFKGENLGKTFQIVNADTEETVYTGEIEEKTLDEESGEYVSKGDFTDFVLPGTYYIETDIIGRSYDFQIKEDIYTDILNNIFGRSLFSYIDTLQMVNYEHSDITLEEYQQLTNRKDVFEECMALNAQGLALQYYPLCYEEFDQDHFVIQEIYNEAEWLMLMQNKDGSVHAGLYQPQGNVPALIAPVSREATAAFCGSMAMTAKMFENVDKDNALRYRQAAKSAWKYIKQSAEDSASFQADAWMLWLTGEKQYLTNATQYLKKQIPTLKEDRLALYGALAYVSSEAKTDVDICASLMKQIMEISEETVDTVRRSSYQIYSTDMQLCYDRMLIVCIANYAVPSVEYVEVMEDHLHYLLGRNRNGYRYIAEDGSLMATTDTLGKTREWDGIVRLMLSSIWGTSVE